MKKISFLSVLSILALPAVAQENTISDVDEVVSQNESVVEEQSVSNDIAKQFEQPKYESVKTESNPETKFPRGLQLGVGVSPTSGLNGFIGYNNKKFDSFWAKRFGIRFDFATFSPIKSKLNREINDAVGDEGFEIDDGLNIENVAVNAKHYGAIVDFYPFGDTWFLGGWRISGGYFTGKLDLKADVHGTPKEGKIEFELNDQKYYYTGDEMYAKAMANWKYSGPYVGTGFDLGLLFGLKMYFDAGVVFTGNTAKFDIDVPIDGLVDANGVSVTEGSAVYDEYVSNKNKVLNDARDEIKDYPYYPIVKLGFMYRF